MQELKDIPIAVKKECHWVSEIIVDSHKLYELCFDISSKDKSMSAEAKTWVALSTDAVNDITQWFERDLDDCLKEMDEVDPSKVEEDEEKIKSIITIAPRKWTKLYKLISTFDSWEFDIFKYYEILEESTLVHFGFKLFNSGLLEKFSIPDNNFSQLL